LFSPQLPPRIELYGANVSFLFKLGWFHQPLALN
jgi:hypothetical protein